MMIDRRWTVGGILIVLGVAGRSIGQAERPGGDPKVTAEAARDAEADYRKDLAEAEAAYKRDVERARGKLIYRLNAVMGEAARAEKPDEAVALKGRVAELVKEQAAGQDSPEPRVPRAPAEAVPAAVKPVETTAVPQDSPERKARRALADAIQGVTWVGSPHGPVVFDRSGLITTTKPNLGPWRWEAVDKTTVVARYDGGNIDVFTFDLENGVVLSYFFGVPRKENLVWVARRARGQ